MITLNEFLTRSPNPSFPRLYVVGMHLLELLSEHDELDLVIDGQDTSSGNTTENVGTGTLEERLDTLLGNNLLEGMVGRLVLDGLTTKIKWSEIGQLRYIGSGNLRGHHHTTTDGIKRVRGNTGTSGDTPTESERGQEVALKVSDEDDWLDGVVHTEVQTTVNDDTKDRRTETTVPISMSVAAQYFRILGNSQSSKTVRSQSLLVHIH